MLEKILRALGVYRIYEVWLHNQIKKGTMPQHIAVIMDGNRRWARRRSLFPWLGHRYGAKKAREFLRWCLDLNIKTVTIYVFSTENFLRSPDEVKELMKIIEEEVVDALNNKDIRDNKVRIKILGKKELLPASLREKLEQLERNTEKYDKHFLNIAIAYGGRIEIVDAVRNIAMDVLTGKLNIEQISEFEIEKRLYTSHLPNPHPDLVIRTSGEERLSGFLLWQTAYSELYFTDVYWPDFRKIDLWRAIRTYQKRERRFGR
ncbi:MAG: polyprenyl diphosphate synthase [Thermoprotei archaeon]